MKDSKKSESLEALEKLRDSLPRPPKDTQLDEATLDVLFDDVSPDQRAIAEMQRERDEVFGLADAPPVTPGKYSPRDEALVQVAIALGMPNAQVPKTVREIRDWAEKHRPLSTTDNVDCPECLASPGYACVGRVPHVARQRASEATLECKHNEAEWTCMEGYSSGDRRGWWCPDCGAFCDESNKWKLPKQRPDYDQYRAGWEAALHDVKSAIVSNHLAPESSHDDTWNAALDEIGESVDRSLKSGPSPKRSDGQ